MNEEGLFNVEYADVLGIPFDFTAKPVISKPQPPRETVQVRALPERSHLEIQFPRVQGYRIDLPDERLTAEFTPDSVLMLTPDLVGPSITHNAGIIGETVNLSLEHLADMRHSTLLMHLTKRLLMTKWRDPGEEPKMHLFGQLKRITKEWLDHCLICKNHNLGLEVPYRYGSETRHYRPDFILKIDDGHGADNLLNLIVEIKGYRGEDAKDKKLTMDTYWVPGVNRLGLYGRWAFVEFVDVYQMQDDFAKTVETAFNTMMLGVVK